MDFNASQLARELADLAHRRYCHNIHVLQYLYVKPSAGAKPGVVVVSEERPDSGFELATGECVPRDRTVDGIVAWMLPILRRLPILATESR